MDTYVSTPSSSSGPTRYLSLQIVPGGNDSLAAPSRPTSNGRTRKCPACAGIHERQSLSAMAIAHAFGSPKQGAKVMAASIMLQVSAAGSAGPTGAGVG